MNFRWIILITLLTAGVFLVLMSQKIRPPKFQHTAAVGLEVPSFKVYDSSGNTITSESLRGKTVLVHFWASWCKECREEMPEIVKIYHQKKNDPNFVFLGIVYREDTAVSKRFLEKFGYDIPIHTDPDGETASLFGVTGVPETYVIDPEGIVRKKVIGSIKGIDLPI